jgi:hypothetical protein
MKVLMIMRMAHGRCPKISIFSISLDGCTTISTSVKISKISNVRNLTCQVYKGITSNKQTHIHIHTHTHKKKKSKDAGREGLAVDRLPIPGVLGERRRIVTGLLIVSALVKKKERERRASEKDQSMCDTHSQGRRCHCRASRRSVCPCTRTCLRRFLSKHRHWRIPFE